MEENFFQARNYKTYYFAQIISDVVSDPFPYLRELENFYAGNDYQQFCLSFSKVSVLHEFAGFVIRNWLEDINQAVDLDDRREQEREYIPINFRELPINEALNLYDIQHTSFEEWLKEEGKSFETAQEDDVYEYYQEYLFLTGIIEMLIDEMVEEVFFVMFQNRAALKMLNEMIAQFVIRDIDVESLPPDEANLFQGDGELKEVKIPKWVRKAVYHRERGRCALCKKDISGLVSVHNTRHYDFFVPLSRGGMNDITNIHLLCTECLHNRSSMNDNELSHYERWYKVTR